MNNDDINDYLPSLLNPRRIKKERGDLSLTQNSTVSRCSLSLKRKNGLATVRKSLHKTFPFDKENGKTNNNNIGLINKKNLNKIILQEKGFDSSAENVQSIALEVNKARPDIVPEKENSQNILNTAYHDNIQKPKSAGVSIGFTAVQDVHSAKDNADSSPFSFEDQVPEPVKSNTQLISNNESLISVSSATELGEEIDLDDSTTTIDYEVTDQPIMSVSFGIMNCETVNISTKNSSIKNIVVTNRDSGMNVDCHMIEGSHISIIDSSEDDIPNRDDDGPTPPKKASVAVNLEIKKNKTTETLTKSENSKVLILNTDNIERLSHVIVQPPNYNLVKRKFSDRSKFKNNLKRKLRSVGNGKTADCDHLKQKKIDFYFRINAEVSKKSDRIVAKDEVLVCDDNEVMSKNYIVADAGKCDRSGRHSSKSIRREVVVTSNKKSRNVESAKHAGKNSSAEAPRASPSARNDSVSSTSSPKRTLVDSRTRFAVDAFSYGNIPNVKYYFLTHFHSDHYSGLKKGFDKLLYCSKITADLCISRLGVNPKNIMVLNYDETIIVDEIEVTAIDANHCPGAVMLVFTLPNGRSILHTGDFRASPAMESYPIFWNKEIHTIYLDSTYCNPRYDFPTQDQSLEMALYILRQKKLALEKVGKTFSKVLIVCGTYTIGKEKFFLGMARRVGCSVWACPEKDKVLQAVEGRSFSTAPPAACQLHVVPMRDLHHEKLRSYLDSLQSHFTEVVAFKPSGWENGKNSTVEKDCVTIHGIPYSEHSSFSEMIRFVKFLQPEQVIPTVDISGGMKAVQKYLPCPLVSRDTSLSQSKVTDYFRIENRTKEPAVT